MRAFATTNTRHIRFPRNRLGRQPTSRLAYHYYLPKRWYFASLTVHSSIDYKSYRNNWNPDRKQLLAYNQRTLDVIDPEIYDWSYGCIKVASEKLADHQERCLPQTGPTGKWEYQWTTSNGDTKESYSRTYQRRISSSLPGDDGDINGWSNVFGIDERFETVDLMSLSMDECLLAVLVESRITDRSEIRVIHMDIDETTAQVCVKIPVSTIQGPVTALEFGPLVGNDSASSSTLCQLYCLFLVAATDTDDPLRPDTVYTCELLNQSTDESASCLSLTALPPKVVFTSDDRQAHVHLQRSKGGCHMLALEQLQTSNRVWISGNTSPTTFSLILGQAGQDVVHHVDATPDGVLYILAPLPLPANAENKNLEHDNGDLVLWEAKIAGESPVQLLTNDGTNSRELREKPRFEDEAMARVVVKASSVDRTIVDMEVFKSHIALLERSRVDGQLVALQLVSRSSSGHSKVIRLDKQDSPAVVASVEWEGNMHFNAKHVRYVQHFPAQLSKTYMSKLENGECIGAKNPEQSTADNEIHSKRVLVPSLDGTTQVPLTLVYQAGQHISAMRSKPLKVVLTGYGSYGEPVDISYNPSLRPLIEQGAVLAFAHTRGGSELGTSWRYHSKRSSIDDFIACAAFLKGPASQQVLEDVNVTTDVDKILIGKAFSAGGILVGSAYNFRPDLFDRIILTNPFLDVYETLMNPRLPLSLHERNEFAGHQNSVSEVQFYCPVCTIDCVPDSCNRTSFMLTCSLDDVHTPYWNTFIYGESLRDKMAASDYPENAPRIHYWVNATGGHTLGSSRLHIGALEAAFILGDLDD